MNQNQTESKPASVEESRDEGLDETICSGVVVWAEDATRTARKCVYDDGDFVRMTRETRSDANSEWAVIGEKTIYKAELRAASVFLPNAEVSDRRAHGNENTTGANGGSLH